VVSGFFFTIFPIQEIRSEHLIRASAPQAIDAAALPPLSDVRGVDGQPPVRITIERRPDRQVLLAEFADGAAPVLYDAATLEQLSPLTPEQASAIARTHVTLASAPTHVTRVTQANAEYRGALPAYRVQFAEGGLAVYVAENTGVVTARRSDLWRLYDTLWALHIMDWQNHEDFNHPLIVIVTALTLISVLAGIVLIPYRIRFRRAARAN